MHIRTEIELTSSKEHVWKKLVCFADYAKWNKFITNLNGTVEVGSILKVTIELPGKKPALFTPKVSHVEPGTEFRWVGKLLFEWLFRGEHYFRLESKGKGTTFIHGEKFSGLLAPLVLHFIKDATKNGFATMNANLEASLKMESSRSPSADLPAVSNRKDENRNPSPLNSLTHLMIDSAEVKIPLLTQAEDSVEKNKTKSNEFPKSLAKEDRSFNTKYLTEKAIADAPVVQGDTHLILDSEDVVTTLRCRS